MLFRSHDHILVNWLVVEAVSALPGDGSSTGVMPELGKYSTQETGGYQVLMPLMAGSNTSAVKSELRQYWGTTDAGRAVGNKWLQRQG